MALGQARTNRFQIGTAELRVGKLEEARMLTQKHSVGLIDEATVSYSRETAQLMGGFPRKLVDETPISESTTITATLREYSRTNLGLLLGKGSSLGAVNDFSKPSSAAMTGGAATPTITLTNTSIAVVGAPATAQDLVAGTVGPFAANDIVTGYIEGRPELTFVGTVLAQTATDIDVTAMDAGLYTDINAAIADGKILRVFRTATIGVGDIAQTEYFSASLVQKDLKTGRPIIFNFWKVSSKGGMEYATNASDYASTELSLEVLEPTAADYATNGPLDHLADVIPLAPMYEMVNSADSLN